MDTEHLLYGLLYEEDTTAAQLLTILNISRESLCSELERIMERSATSPLFSGQMSPRIPRIIELARVESLHFRQGTIGTEHLLLGLLREQEGVGAKVLIRHGVTLETARKALRGMLGEEELPAPDPNETELRKRADVSRALDILHNARENRLTGLPPTAHQIFSFVGGFVGIALLVYAIQSGSIPLGLLSLLAILTALFFSTSTLTPKEYRAAQEITVCDDIRAVPELARLLTWHDTRIQSGAKYALTRLLPQLGDMDSALLPVDAQMALARILTWRNADENPNLILAILNALTRNGQTAVIPYVETLARLAEPTEQRRIIRDAAEQCLYELNQRRDTSRAQKELLRASAVPSARPDELLRPAAESHADDPAELLRPTADPDAAK